MTLRPGMFFKHARSHIEILRASDPKKALPAFKGPVLFLNGSRDHRDSEHKWVEACAPSQGKLIVYQGGDHFFSHDKRFDQKLRDDTWNFFKDSRLVSA
jgi:fermentation-respiration switch protein FrsA (DUF1100 family)